jgi:hypothetical protein
MASQDYGFACKFTTIGKTTLSMFYSINYLDLDYGIVGAYYSVGSSGPAIGGGNGYMLMRFKNNAYPVKPRFVDPNDIGGNKRKGRPLHNNNTRRSINASPVHVGPIPKGEYKVMPLKKK